MNFIPLASPNIIEEDLIELQEILLSGILVQGPHVEKLEKNIENLLHTQNASAVSNGTATMHLALKVLNIGPGDEVIVPAFSYIATANVVELVGAKPVFVDIDLSTFNIDVSKIEKAITHKTKAIIPVHEFGLACDITEIIKIADNNKIWVIEDAACALGAKQNEKFVGSFGHFASFSFHPRKAITSGEGGIIISQNTEHTNKIRSLRNHGIQIIQGKMEFVEAGFNYRMTDFQASLINNQLKRFYDIINKKQFLARVYFESIKNKNIILPFVPENKNHTWQTFHILFEKGIDRNKIISILKNKNIGSNYGAQCIPAQLYYQKKYNLDFVNLFPNATYAYNYGLAIPIYEKLSISDISYIAEQLNQL